MVVIHNLMTQQLNGTIMIGGSGINGICRKVFDLKITSTWPIISISIKQPQFFRNWDGTTTQIQNPFQHLSLPPDLDIHLSQKQNHHFLHRGLVNASGNLNYDFAYLLGWFSQPIGDYPQPIGAWYQAELFFLTPDQRFSDKTGIFVELFVHKKENEIAKILAEPFFDSSMRLISNHEPVAVRTYLFCQLIRQRNPRIVPNYFLSMRYGFWESSNNQSLIVVKSMGN